MKNFKNSSCIALVIILFTSAGDVFASDFPLPGGDGDTGTGIDVPINGLIYLAMAVGGYLGFKNLKSIY